MQLRAGLSAELAAQALQGALVRSLAAGAGLEPRGRGQAASLPRHRPAVRPPVRCVRLGGTALGSMQSACTLGADQAAGLSCRQDAAELMLMQEIAFLSSPVVCLSSPVRILRKLRKGTFQAMHCAGMCDMWTACAL